MGGDKLDKTHVVSAEARTPETNEPTFEGCARPLTAPRAIPHGSPEISHGLVEDKAGSDREDGVKKRSTCAYRPELSIRQTKWLRLLRYMHTQRCSACRLGHCLDRDLLSTVSAVVTFST